MPWFAYSSDVQLRGKALVDLERDKNCPLCYAKLQRLAWRDLLPPYHWQPFGFICSVCNAVYVGAESRLTKPSGKKGPYNPADILERATPGKRPKASKASVQAP
jgi:hypothetical protein